MRKKQQFCSGCGVFIGEARIRKNAVCRPCYEIRRDETYITIYINKLESLGYTVTKPKRPRNVKN